MPEVDLQLASFANYLESKQELIKVIAVSFPKMGFPAALWKPTSTYRLRPPTPGGILWFFFYTYHPLTWYQVVPTPAHSLHLMQKACYWNLPFPLKCASICGFGCACVRALGFFWVWHQAFFCTSGVLPCAFPPPFANPVQWTNPSL